MPKTFQFVVPELGVGESAPVTARMFESATAAGTRTQVGADTLLADMTALGGSLYAWPISAADGTKHYWLELLDVTGYGTSPAAYLPPAASSETVVVYVDSADLGLGPVDGLDFSSEPINYAKVSIGPVGVSGITVKTGTSPWTPGHAELEIAADCGTVQLSLRRPGGQLIQGKLDTTGKGGLTLNFASLLK